MYIEKSYELKTLFYLCFI